MKVLFLHFLCDSVPLTVHFGDSSKVTTKVSPLDTTSDLLESVKDQLTSSATQLWLVDQSGDGKKHQLVRNIRRLILNFMPLLVTLLEPRDHPAGYQAKAHRFYALDPSQRVSASIFVHGMRGHCIPMKPVRNTL